MVALFQVIVIYFPKESSFIDHSQMSCLGKYNLGSNTLNQQKRKRKGKNVQMKEELVHEPLSNMQQLPAKTGYWCSI